MNSNRPLWVGIKVREALTGRLYQITGFAGLGSTVFVRADDGKDEREIPLSDLREWYEVIE